MKLKFSIIVPVFNGEAYIEKALINLVRIRKNCQEIEVIIVDDGSVDNTRKICLNYIENNIWIKLYSKKNGGVSSARNLGLEKAKGEFIIFLDSDDSLDESTFKYLYNKTNLNADIVITKLEKIDKGIVVTYPRKKISFLDRDSILKSTVDLFGIRGYVGNKIYKKSFLDNVQTRFDEELVFSEDMDFFIQAALKSNNIYYIDRVLYRYNYVEDSTTYTPDSQLNLLKSLRKIIGLLTDNDISYSTIKKFENYYLQVFISIYLNSRLYDLRYNISFEESIMFLKNSKTIMKLKYKFFWTVKDIAYFIWSIKRTRGEK